MTVRIACAQLDLAVGEVTANRATALTAIEHAAAGGAELVVLPELTNSGYAFTDLETARRCAEGLDGPTVRQWRTASRRLGIVLVGGFCEAGDEALPRNSAVIIEDGEVLTVYRKAHLWDAEPRYFTPGDVAPEVVPTSLGRLATMICYDLEFPEYARLPALAGAQLLAAPTNWPTEPAPADATPIEIVRVQANAAVNRMCVAACDRVGAENGVE
ncbi:MAG: nitrilase-related carbon-nitrogen hydrolase, partial [Mycobacterium sp.]